MEIRRGIVFSRIDIDCCDVVILIVKQSILHIARFFFRYFWITLFVLKWVRMKGVLKLV